MRILTEQRKLTKKSLHLMKPQPNLSYPGERGKKLKKPKQRPTIKRCMRLVKQMRQEQILPGWPSSGSKERKLQPKENLYNVIFSHD